MYVGYSEQIAKQWNARQYSAGYAVGFTMPGTFMDRYETQTIAYEEHREYKIPVAELDVFNSHIQGRIRVAAAFAETNEHSEQRLLTTAASCQ